MWEARDGRQHASSIGFFLMQCSTFGRRFEGVGVGSDGRWQSGIVIRAILRDFVLKTDCDRQWVWKKKKKAFYCFVKFAPLPLFFKSGCRAFRLHFKISFDTGWHELMAGSISTALGSLRTCFAPILEKKKKSSVPEWYMKLSNMKCDSFTL